MVENNLYIFGGRSDDGTMVKRVEKKSLTDPGEFGFVHIDGHHHLARNRFIAYPLHSLVGYLHPMFRDHQFIVFGYQEEVCGFHNENHRIEEIPLKIERDYIKQQPI